MIEPQSGATPPPLTILRKLPLASGRRYSFELTACVLKQGSLLGLGNAIYRLLNVKHPGSCQGKRQPQKPEQSFAYCCCKSTARSWLLKFVKHASTRLPG